MTFPTPIHIHTMVEYYVKNYVTTGLHRYNYFYAHAVHFVYYLLFVPTNTHTDI
jgi:hypothetical protein